MQDQPGDDPVPVFSFSAAGPSPAAIAVLIPHDQRGHHDIIRATLDPRRYSATTKASPAQLPVDRGKVQRFSDNDRQKSSSSRKDDSNEINRTDLDVAAVLVQLASCSRSRSRERLHPSSDINRVD